MVLPNAATCRCKEFRRSYSLLDVVEDACMKTIPAENLFADTAEITLPRR